MSVDASAQAAHAMDRMYRRQRHVYDATRKFYLLGRDRLIAGLTPGQGSNVLELGCGTGRNLIAVARRYPGVRCFGVDVSNEMLAQARRSIIAAGLGERIIVAQGDAARCNPAALFGARPFERIFISYTLSMIPQWRAVIDHAIALLPPVGELHIVDFGAQERLPRLFRTALRRWLALFHVDPRDELAARLEVGAAAAGADLRLERPFLGYAQYAVLRLRPASAVAPRPSAAA